MFKSHEKGRAAEREVARLCQEWWSKLEPDCEFQRTPISGGWATPNIREHFRASGDLMSSAEKWPFTVEVKRRECWSMANLFDGKRSPAWTWWRQTVEAAREEGGVPMLWGRKNQNRPGQPRFPWFIMLPVDYLIGLPGKIPTPDVQWAGEQLLRNKVDYAGELPALWFHDRLLEITPKRFAR